MGQQSSPKKKNALLDSEVQGNEHHAENPSTGDDTSTLGQGPQLSILTQAEIEKQKISKEMIWYLLMDQDPLGPYHRDDLKRFIEENLHFSLETKAANLAEKRWAPLHTYPEFQRRRPVVLKENDSGENKKIYVLQGGFKNGPFSFDQIEEKVEAKELLLTDHISLNNGATWIKIFEHPLFDRRSRKLANLPSSFPQEKTFILSDSEVFNDLQKNLAAQNSPEKLEKEGLIGLAYMGKLSSLHKQPFSEENNTPVEDEVPLSHAFNFWERYKVSIACGGLLLSLGVGVFFFFSGQPKNFNPFSNHRERTQPPGSPSEKNESENALIQEKEESKLPQRPPSVSAKTPSLGNSTPETSQDSAAKKNANNLFFPKKRRPPSLGNQGPESLEENEPEILEEKSTDSVVNSEDNSQGDVPLIEEEETMPAAKARRGLAGENSPSSEAVVTEEEGENQDEDSGSLSQNSKADKAKEEGTEEEVINLRDDNVDAEQEILPLE